MVRGPLSRRRPLIQFGGLELWLKMFLLFLERQHSRQGPWFPFEVNKFRVKTFFFGNHFAVKGTKIPFEGPELWVKTFFFFFWRPTSQRLGAHTGDSYPYQTAKIFRLKSQQEP